MTLLSASLIGPSPHLPGAPAPQFSEQALAVFVHRCLLDRFQEKLAQTDDR